MKQEKTTDESLEVTYTTSEVAKMLNISDATMLRWLKADKIPGFFRIGRRWLIRKSDLEAFINNQVIKTSYDNNSKVPSTD